jgi:hypothetical protein
MPCTGTCGAPMQGALLHKMIHGDIAARQI